MGYNRAYLCVSYVEKKISKLTHSVENLRYLCCVSGNETYLCYLRSEFVNTGNVVSKMAACNACIHHEHFFFFFYFFFLEIKLCNVCWACAMYIAKVNIKQLNHYFSVFWTENLNLIEGTWQRQHKRSRTYLTYAAYNFMQKVLWPKNLTGSKQNIVSRSLTRTLVS